MSGLNNEELKVHIGESYNLSMRGIDCEVIILYVGEISNLAMNRVNVEEVDDIEVEGNVLESIGVVSNFWVVMLVHLSLPMIDLSIGSALIFMQTMSMSCKVCLKSYFAIGLAVWYLSDK